MNTADCKTQVHARYTLFEREYMGSVHKAQVLYSTIAGVVTLIPCVYSEKWTEDGTHIDTQTLYFDSPAQAVNYVSSLGRACA